MSCITIIRHAEKPGGGVRGVNADGRKSQKSLTPRGWQRAGALVRLFAPASGTQPRRGIAAPSAIYASRVEAHARSKRPKFTVKPLARELRLAVDTRFGVEGEAPLAELLSTSTEPVLVCWHHEGIPRLASLIAPEVTFPKKWPQDRFDVIWLLAREHDGAPWTFTQAPQRLLPGDVEETI